MDGKVLFKERTVRCGVVKLVLGTPCTYLFFLLPGKVCCQNECENVYGNKQRGKIPDWHKTADKGRQRLIQSARRNLEEETRAGTCCPRSLTLHKPAESSQSVVIGVGGLEPVGNGGSWYFISLLKETDPWKAKDLGSIQVTLISTRPRTQYAHTVK